MFLRLSNDTFASSAVVNHLCERVRDRLTLTAGWGEVVHEVAEEIIQLWIREWTSFITVTLCGDLTLRSSARGTSPMHLLGSMGT